MTTYLDPNIQTRLAEKKKILDQYRPFPKPILERLREQFIIEWTYNSNAIEGNTLTLRETMLVLERGITVKGKSLREHFEVTNHRAAIFELEKIIQVKKKISEESILKLHAHILDNIDDRYAGVYRRENVRILGARLIPPSPYKVPMLMKDFFAWLHENPEKLSVIELAAVAHYKFVSIHPFIDGNGRTGRLFMNLLLMQYGYPPAVILVNDRKKYYDVLNSANLGDIKPFVQFIAQSVERSIGLYLDAIEPKTDESHAGKEYILLKDAAKDSRYSQEYLSLLARRAKIHAIKKGRDWYTTEDTVEDYEIIHSKNLQKKLQDSLDSGTSDLSI